MDEDTTQAAWAQLQLEYREWLEELAANPAARQEFHDWLASTHRTNVHEPQQSH
jgi:hypothetical protein